MKSIRKYFADETGVCADVDNLACALLATRDPNICSNDCVANSLCPVMCNKCCKEFVTCKGNTI